MRYCEGAGLGSPEGTWSSYSEKYKIKRLCPVLMFEHLYLAMPKARRSGLFSYLCQ